MARTASTMLDLGTAAPDFNLPDTQGQRVNLNDFANQPILVVFACNHCPYVLHILQYFASLMPDYQSQGLSVVMINANDVSNFPDDSPEKMRELSEKYQLSFPYLFDESQQVAQAYRAACTPDFFLFDASHRLYYRGQFDDSRPGNDKPVDGHDLINAIERLLKDQAAPKDQIPSMGCNIKWKAGNEPDYFG
jgi:peroxiredoxin